MTHHVDSIKQFLVPMDKSSLQRFLGLSSYYRAFVPGMARLAAPLMDLLKADVEFRWSAVQQEAFNMIKDALIDAVQLQIFCAA